MPKETYSSKKDAALVAALSKSIVNGEDALVDYKITEKIPNYSKTRVQWFRERIRKEMQRDKLNK